MFEVQALKRQGAPEDGGVGGVIFFGLIAAAGFLVGWLAQALGGGY